MHGAVYFSLGARSSVGVSRCLRVGHMRIRRRVRSRRFSSEPFVRSVSYGDTSSSPHALGIETLKMILADLGALLFVAGAILAAAVAGGFGRPASRLADRIILPAGIAGTFIGVIHMLQVLDDPASLPEGLAIALLTSLYAAVVKLGLGIYRVDNGESPAPATGAKGTAGALVLVVVVAGAMTMGSGPRAFFSLPAVVIVALGVAMTVGLTKVSSARAYVDRLIRFLPGVGLLILFGSSVALLRRADDASAMGPILAVGLLGHLYATLVWMLVSLLRPELVDSPRESSGWLHYAASLAGVAGMMAAVIGALR